MNNFEALRNQALSSWEELTHGEVPVIYLGAASCGRAAGALDVLEAIQQTLSELNLPARIVQVGCIGPCYLEPLMDITLPGGDGLQLAESFLRRTETFDIPVIFITASKKPALLKKVMELGAVGLFEKPFDTEKLLNSIGRKFYRMDLLRSGQPSVANKST